jgi:hypothetical protein
METTFLDKKDYIKLYTKQAGEDRKKFWKPLLKLGVSVVLVYLAIGSIFGDSFLAQLIGQLAGFFITLFAVKYILNLIDTQNTSYKETFNSFSGKQILFALGAYILMILATYIGFLLLIIPGIIISYMLMMVPMIGSETTTKPIAALKESRRLTGGYKMKMFLTWLSVAIHYMLIPILMLLVYVLSLPLGLGWSFMIAGIAAIIGLAFYIYAFFAIATLLPRMYRDLQKIKSHDTVSDEIVDVVAEEVVVEAEIVTESK